MRFVKEKKKKRPVFSIQQRAQYIRYKFLFFGTEVCQASAGTIRILLLRSCTGYRRNKNLLYVATHKFVSRTDFSKSGTVRKSLLLFETGLPFYPPYKTRDNFSPRNILDKIFRSTLPNATYRSLEQIQTPPQLKMHRKCTLCGRTRTKGDNIVRSGDSSSLPPPPPLPIMDLLLVVTVASQPTFFLNEQYRPKI